MITYTEFKQRWDSWTEAQRDRVRAKAEWEHMSLWATVNEWWSQEDPKPFVKKKSLGQLFAAKRKAGKRTKLLYGMMQPQARYAKTVGDIYRSMGNGPDK